MKTEKRIEKLLKATKFVAEKFEKKVIVADIGTDHGYLAETLSKQDFVSEIIATDISSKSLSKLEKMIENKGLQKIKTAVGDGLEPVANADISVIAGMGGWEIINILKNQNKQKTGELKCPKFVLQPAQNVIELRNYLFENKIKILRDFVVQDADRFYPVICVDVTKKKGTRKSIKNVWIGRDNNFSNPDYEAFLKDTREFLVFLEEIPKKRIMKDKVLREKLKLYHFVNKKLKRR